MAYLTYSNWYLCFFVFYVRAFFFFFWISLHAAFLRKTKNIVEKTLMYCIAGYMYSVASSCFFFLFPFDEYCFFFLYCFYATYFHSWCWWTVLQATTDAMRTLLQVRVLWVFLFLGLHLLIWFFLNHYFIHMGAFCLWVTCSFKSMLGTVWTHNVFETKDLFVFVFLGVIYTMEISNSQLSSTGIWDEHGHM